MYPRASAQFMKNFVIRRVPKPIESQCSDNTVIMDMENNGQAEGLIDLASSGFTGYASDFSEDKGINDVPEHDSSEDSDEEIDRPSKRI